MKRCPRSFKSPDLKVSLVQVFRLEPNICSSPDERVRFSARQNAVLRAVKVEDRLDHIVSKYDAIICPMLSPRMLRSRSLRPAGLRSPGLKHPRLADDGL